MIQCTGPGIPPPPRANSEPPRGLILEAPQKLGDPDTFYFNKLTGISTDVPRSVTRHSPGGFDWGYSGSGPQDLALNILNYVYPPGSDGHEPVFAGDAYVSRTAERLYGDYTREVVSKIPKEGSFVITRGEVKDWVTSRLQDVAPEERLAHPFANRTITPVERTIYLEPPPKLPNIPATNTDQMQDHRWDWESLHMELAQVNATIAKVTRQYVLTDLTQISDQEQRQRNCYSKLISVGRLIHSIDVELFRAALCNERHNVATILEHAPPMLKPHLERFVALFDQESATRLTWFQRTGTETVAREVMDRKIATGISVIAFGPALVIACTNEQSWVSVNARLRNDQNADCGGFVSFVSIAGTPVPVIAIPTHYENPFDFDGQVRQRGVFIHEREHLAQSFRSRAYVESLSCEMPRTAEEAKQMCLKSHISFFRDEVLAYVLGDDWSLYSKRALIASGPRALYDYPHRDNDYWMSQLKDMLPGMSEAEHQGLLDSAAKDFRKWRKTVMDALNSIDSAPDRGAHHLIRALDCLPAETWPKHLKRMHKLGLFKPSP